MAADVGCVERASDDCMDALSELDPNEALIHLKVGDVTLCLQQIVSCGAHTSSGRPFDFICG